MSQRSGTFYNFLNNPIIYKIVQKVMSGTSFRANIIKKNIKKKKLKILDIGCGPAEILALIPECEYYGYDIDTRSINYAKKKFNKKNHHFFNKRFNEREIKKLPKFDYVIFFGILHHLNDSEIKKLLNLCKKKMKKKSKLLTGDPVIIENQNIIARNLILRDRGKNVRKKKDYIKILKKYFKNVKPKITHQFFIPYTWFATVCSK